MHHLHHHLHFLKNRELNELYVSVALKSFAISMISIFLPIYLLKLNYSLTTVLIFFAILNISHALFIIPAAKISSKYGFKHSISYSIPVLIIFYLALSTLEQFHWPIYLLAVIFGINNALYWMGYHVDFSKFSNKKNRGKEIGKAKIVSLIFHVLGPIIGGLIITFIGFSALFVIVSILLLASVIPLFFSKDIHNPINFSIRGIFKGQSTKNTFAFIGHGIESGAASVIWPVFIFFSILNNFTTLGLISSLSVSFSLLFVFIIGRFSDVRRRLVLKIGSLLNTVIWGIRFFIKTTFQVFIIDSFYGVSQTLIQIPFDALSYDKANKANIVKFIIFREIIIQIARTVFFLIMAIMATLTIGFLLGGGASLLYLLF